MDFVFSFSDNLLDLGFGFGLLVNGEQLRVQVVLALDLGVELSELLLSLIVLLAELLFSDVLKSLLPFILLFLSRSLLLLPWRRFCDFSLSLQPFLLKKFLERFSSIRIDLVWNMRRSMRVK